MTKFKDLVKEIKMAHPGKTRDIAGALLGPLMLLRNIIRPFPVQ
jgi:hypothetical protein